MAPSCRILETKDLTAGVWDLSTGPPLLSCVILGESLLLTDLFPHF